jgi:hypothetical protein
MKKCFLIAGLMLVAGCMSDAVKSEAVKWVNAGTLVSVGPDIESTGRPGRAKSAVLGDTKLNSTRIETTKGVYIVSEKIGVVEPGIPVNVGYNLSDKEQDTPLYLSVGGKRYKIVR